MQEKLEKNRVTLNALWVMKITNYGLPMKV